MSKKLSALLEVRKIIALSVISLFIILSLKGSLESQTVEYVIISVVAFYFGKSTALDKPRGDT